MMDDTTRKWLSGCAVGCAVAVVLVILAIGGAYLGIKRVVQSAQKIEASMESVTARYGPTSAFRPPASGEIPADRVEAFLDARRRAAAERERLERTLAALAGTTAGDTGSSAGGIGTVRAAVVVTPQMMAYLNSRSEALLEADIGLGEYLYLYILVYPVWLDTPVDDGPPFIATGHPGRWEAWIDEDVTDRRRNETRHRINRTVLPMLRNQLEDLRANPDAEGAWLTELAAEVERIDGDPQRLPWQDGLPERTAQSLEPFREVLRASYSPLCHPVELAVQQHARR